MIERRKMMNALQRMRAGQEVPRLSPQQYTAVALAAGRHDLVGDVGEAWRSLDITQRAWVTQVSPKEARRAAKLAGFFATSEPPAGLPGTPAPAAPESSAPEDDAKSG